MAIKKHQTSVAGWVVYTQNATLVFISAYTIYVFIGKIMIPLSTRLYQQRYLIWRQIKHSIQLTANKHDGAFYSLKDGSEITIML